MPTLAEIREQYPQYQDMPDSALADALHSKFYSDIPQADFYGKIGFQPPSVAADVAKSGGIGVAEGAIGLAGLPGDVAELGARGIDWATRKIGGALGVDVKPREARAPTYGSADIKKGVESVTGEFYKPQTTAGKYARTVGEFTPAALAGPGGLARRAVTQAVAPGLASEAAGQATAGTAAEPYARVGAALAAPMAAGAASRVITPVRATPERQAMVQTLADEGVTSLTAGQRTGNKTLQYAESILGDAPGAGQGATRIQQEGQRQFTRAATTRADEAGRLADAGPEALQQNYQRHAQNFQQLAARNTLQMDQQFARDIGQAIRQYERVPPSQQKAVVENYVDDIIAHAQQGGQMPGRNYQEMRSRLSRQSNALRNSDPTLSEALRDLRNSLDNAMGRSISPQDRALWNQTRREYAAQKDLAKSVSRAGEASAEGQVVPANLRNTIAANNRDAYSRGQGPFNDLARAGSAVMAPLPNSGTGQRVAIHGLAAALAGGGATALGPAGVAAAGIPAALGRILMSRPGQAYLGNQALAQTPEYNRILAAALRGQAALSSPQMPAIQGR